MLGLLIALVVGAGSGEGVDSFESGFTSRHSIHVSAPPEAGDHFREARIDIDDFHVLHAAPVGPLGRWAVGDGTPIALTYAVGGYSPGQLESLAKYVDGP